MEKKAVKKGLFKVVFGRTVVVVALLVLQCVMLVILAGKLANYGWTIYACFVAITMIVVIKIINDKGNPAFKLAWILPILVVPIVGVAFYLFVKFQIGTKYIGQRLEILNRRTRKYMEQDPCLVEELRTVKPANANLAHFLSQQVGFPIYHNTKVVYFPLGEDKFRELFIQIEQAKSYIFMEYFIVEQGKVWDTLLPILHKKVKEGVEVRFMYDGMCSMTLLPYNYPKKLRSMGIKCKMFSPIKPILSTHYNNRDHRKICVIDGHTGFTGGVNIGDEYVNQRERFGHWKDTAIMMKGEAVQSLTMMFLQMWNVDVKKEEDFGAYLFPKTIENTPGAGYILPYGDSPFDNENVGEHVYFHILNHAKKYVHIMTPYLILDNEMLTTLSYAAKSGIEVVIIMPGIPDKKYAFDVAKTYYGELIEAGVQIFEYTPGFVHAKVFVSDNDTATVGTINLDYRSLYLHFECGVFIYNNLVVHDIELDFQKTLKKCRKITMEDVKKRSCRSKIVGRVLRLFAPLM
ncbi:MAG: cardiolipin synthase [Lachnospiraceae bacterium]